MTAYEILLRRLERAERTLTRAGWTYTEGAEEWRPPLGKPPLLDKAEAVAVAPLPQAEQADAAEAEDHHRPG